MPFYIQLLKGIEWCFCHIKPSNIYSWPVAKEIWNEVQYTCHIYTGITSVASLSSHVKMRPSIYVGRRHWAHRQPAETGSGEGTIMRTLSCRLTIPITLTVLPSLIYLMIQGAISWNQSSAQSEEKGWNTQRSISIQDQETSKIQDYVLIKKLNAGASD